MSLVDLPGYAEALSGDFKPLEEADNGMGDTVGLVEDYLESELEERAREMGLEPGYTDEDFEILVDTEEELTVMYGEFYRESNIPLIGGDIWKCQKTNSSNHRGATSGKREFRVPNNGGHLHIDEANLRAYNNFLQDRKTR
ncbi:MAG: hypothetical protein ABEJ95_05035 [Candidatus Nanohalobium sp.]